MLLKRVVKGLLVAILTLLSKLVLRKYEPTVIAVTGSVGKTSTKDAIYSVLARSRFVRKSQKTLNTDIGVPLTILGAENAWWNPVRWLKILLEGLLLIILPSSYPEWLVLEVGADHPGDIKRFMWLSPDIVVLTHVPDVPVHVEFFDSPEEVLREKKHLVDALRGSGTLIVYGDDRRTAGVGSEAKGKGRRVLTYGMNEGLTARGSDFTLTFEPGTGRPNGIAFTVRIGDTDHHVEMRGTVGRQHMYAALAALAVGEALGVNPAGSVEALEEHRTPPGRMRLLPGIKGTIIIDDSYNSSPAAADEALAALASIPKGKGRKIAVLGDMLELGKYTSDEHRALGKVAAEVVDMLATVGFRARDIAEGALQGGLHESKILQYEDSRRAGKELEGLIKEGDIILIKGSQTGIRLERAVEELMAEPEKAEELLVRQDPEWKKR